MNGKDALKFAAATLLILSSSAAAVACRSTQFAPLFSAFPDWHWEIRNLVVDGDYIAGHFTVTGTHRGAFQGIEATDRRVTISEFTASSPRSGTTPIWTR
jgi:predicted ester cyclase